MGKRNCYSVKAIWDDEASVFYSESDIIGLHIQADSQDEFRELVKEFAPDLILSNHLLKSDEIDKKSLDELFPLILLEMGDRNVPRAVD